VQCRKSQFLESVSARLQDGSRLVSRDVTLRFVGRRTDIMPSTVNNSIDSVTGSDSSTADPGVLTVLTDCVSADHSFNEAIYRQHLDTRVLGSVVLYADVTTTTMNLIEGLASHLLLCNVLVNVTKTAISLLEGSTLRLLLQFVFYLV